LALKTYDLKLTQNYFEILQQYANSLNLNRGVSYAESFRKKDQAAYSHRREHGS